MEYRYNREGGREGERERGREGRRGREGGISLWRDRGIIIEMHNDSTTCMCVMIELI